MKIERILVAIDASPHSVAALEAALVMAERQKAELIGLFVEDDNLMRLAGLPFAREVLFPNALGQPIDALTMRQTLKDLADRAQEAISESAMRVGVSWTFDVRRGSVLTELLAASEKADLVVIGKASHERTRHVRVGAVAANLLVRSPRSVLMLQEGECCEGPAIVVCDGGEECLKNISAATAFAELFGGKPIILLLAKTRQEAARLRDKIGENPALRDLRFRRVSPDETNGLSRISHDEQAGLIILAGLPSTAKAENLPAMFGKVKCPVLVYRVPAPSSEEESG